MDLNLEGKVAWVAGATGALGSAIARALAGEGTCTVLSSRRADAVAELTAELRDGGHDALAVPLDVTDEAQVKEAAKRILAERRRIDILVNSMNVPAYGRFLDLDRATFRGPVETKYLGYVACMQAVLPHMAAQGGGSIVNITGTGGKQPIAVHLPGGSVNAALNLIVKGLALQFGGDGVRINAVSPGPVRSPRQDAMQDAGAGADSAAGAIALGRFCEASEVADAVLFLASERASYVTGTVLYLDGGGVLAT